MTEIPEPVRRQALNPFWELERSPHAKYFDLDGASLMINKFAQLVSPRSVDIDVPATVAALREIGREHDVPSLAWWIAPEHDALVPALEAEGIVHKAAPGFEAIENAMALVHEPRGARPDVETRPVETFEDFVALAHVIDTSFGYPSRGAEMIRAMYDEYLADPTGKNVAAIVDGKIVGAAYAAYGPAGINLFGGSVLEEYRGRGVYRALTWGRWDLAVSRGTPALTVQAGKMSMPICERLGFEFVDRARVFVDDL